MRRETSVLSCGVVEVGPSGTTGRGLRECRKRSRVWIRSPEWRTLTDVETRSDCLKRNFETEGHREVPRVVWEEGRGGEVTGSRGRDQRKGGDVRTYNY